MSGRSRVNNPEIPPPTAPLGARAAEPPEARRLCAGCGRPLDEPPVGRRRTAARRYHDGRCRAAASRSRRARELLEALCDVEKAARRLRAALAAENERDAP